MEIKMIKFRDIYGHDKIKDEFRNAVKLKQERHAYLFEGLQGVGRMSCALAFAAAMVCENPIEGEACGECKNCKLAAAGTHPDIRVVTNALYDDGKKSDSISINTVRAMKNEVYVKPYFSGRKVYIVPYADTLTIEAQNSLLKILEEPPQYCTIILIAENVNVFLPTILSRVIRVSFHPLSFLLVEEALQNICETHSEYDVSRETLSVKARMSGGSIGAALNLLDDTDAEELRRETIERVCALTDRRRREIFEFSSFLKRNKSDAKKVLKILQNWFHDVILLKCGVRNDELINADKTAELSGFCGKITLNGAAALEDITAEYAEYINKNANYPIAAICMAMEYWGEINDRNYRNSL